MRVLLAAAVLVAPGMTTASDAARQRLVERYAETVTFPQLATRCAALPGEDARRWQADIAAWRTRRADVLAQATALVETLATQTGTPRAAMDAAIAQRDEQRHAQASAEDLAFTCQRLGRTLRGEPWIATRGLSALDEDTQREVLDQMLPVASTLMACETVERLVIEAAPPASLRPDPSAASRVADSVEMWNLEGCGKRLDVELSLRFFPDEPPAFSMAFPRRATPQN